MHVYALPHCRPTLTDLFTAPRINLRRSAPACLSQAAWWAVQEAGKHCVASRLRTHWGGPAQTLAALERALQAAAGQLQLEAPPAEDQGARPESGAAAGHSEQRQAAALLLLFAHALEQGVTAAASGSGASRAAAPQPAVAFFAANAKVGWFGACWTAEGYAT